MDEEKPTCCEISWLSGLIDGEGSFVLGISKQKTLRTPRIELKFVITMSRGEWEQKATRIFDLCGIKYSTDIRGTLFRIWVNGTPQVKKLCALIKNSSVVKKAIIERFLDFQSVGYKRNQYCNHDKATIQRIAGDIDFVRKFNRKRNAPYKWDGKRIMEAFGY